MFCVNVTHSLFSKARFPHYGETGLCLAKRASWTPGVNIASTRLNCSYDDGIILLGLPSPRWDSNPHVPP